MLFIYLFLLPDLLLIGLNILHPHNWVSYLIDSSVS